MSHQNPKTIEIYTAYHNDGKSLEELSLNHNVSCEMVRRIAKGIEPYESMKNKCYACGLRRIQGLTRSGKKLCFGCLIKHGHDVATVAVAEKVNK